MSASAETLQFFRDCARTNCGLVLTPDKDYLIEQRLQPIAEANGFRNMDEFGRHCAVKLDTAMLVTIIDRLTTHETSFFRDGHPFEAMERKILPEFHAKRFSAPNLSARLRLWSVASSTGQEAWSLAMLIAEMLESKGGLKAWAGRYEIFGTDISPKVLETARQAVYSELEVSRGLSAERRQKHFLRQHQGWELKPELKKLARFSPLNLLQPFGVIGEFDLIFCRNVLIYFDEPTRAAILSRLLGCLAKDGLLLLGACENSIHFPGLKSVMLGGTTVFVRA